MDNILLIAILVLVVILVHFIGISSIISTKRKNRDNDSLERREKYRAEYLKRSLNLKGKYYEND